MPATLSARAPGPSGNAGAYALLTLTPLLWSINWIIGRGLATDIPPLAMTFFRWFFSVVILAPFAYSQARRDWPLLRRHWRVVAALGIVGICAHNALVYVGLNYTSATNGVILNSFIPVMIVTLSWLWLREPLSGLQAVGVAVSFAGVLTILSRGSLETLLAFRLNGGDLAIILSMAMWAVYTIGLRWQPQGLRPLSFLFALACVGAAGAFPLFVAEAAFGRGMALTPENLVAMVSVALFSSVLAYVFWNRGVERVGANVAGLFLHLMPAYGVVLAWLFLGESLAAYHVPGIGLILTGIWITSRLGRRREPAAAATD